MRVLVKIGSYEIMVLIDIGSTHNFINTRLANQFQLPIKHTAAFSVRVANGEKLMCQGKFEKVQIVIQNVPFSLTVYSLPIIGLDMVLGIQWLKLLGAVVCNWKTLTMEFDWGNQRRHLEGISPQSLQTASLTEISKEIRQGNEAFPICLHTKLEKALRAVPADMQQLLKDYEEIFQEPTKLPPSRGIDHCIPLKKGTEPVNVRPYCYAYFQKAEIEKQLKRCCDRG
ncbi:uncharacterized protein LOC107175001 [Citrus sinensis]|uniref:uncharacterized protein LOC107175001 n=1 Tax=Citrus sinensis TaxID=2711 RepID=UPI000763AB61|nr:uncharacterized protein LOC107175001 [Citrus sinensis]